MKHSLKKNTAKKNETNMKIQDMHQTHGKVEDFTPTTLDQVWGDDGMTRYGTKSLAEYEEQINDMNKVDIMEEARRVGTILTDNTQEIRRRLIFEFEQYVGQFQPSPKIYANKPHPNDKEVNKILNEGR